MAPMKDRHVCEMEDLIRSICDKTLGPLAAFCPER